MRFCSALLALALLAPVPFRASEKRKLPRGANSYLAATPVARGPEVKHDENGDYFDLGRRGKMYIDPVFARQCSKCHGVDGHSGTSAIDLRNLDYGGKADEAKKSIQNGTEKMPGIELKETDLNDILLYLDVISKSRN